MRIAAIRFRGAIAGLALLLAMAAGIAWTGDGPGARRPSLLTMSEDQAARLDPLQKSMRQILLDERDRLAALYDEFASAKDSQRALEIQRRIHEVKLDAQISLLRVQADAARAEGRIEDAERLEEASERVAEPERGWKPVEPAARPEKTAPDQR